MIRLIPLIIKLLFCIYFYSKTDFCFSQTLNKKSIKVFFEEIFEADQKYRWMIMYGTTKQNELDSIKNIDLQSKIALINTIREDKNKVYKEIKDSLFLLQNKLDSINFAKLIPFLQNYGIPKYINKDYLQGLFHHVPLQFKNELKFILLKELKTGNYTPLNYANFVDYLQLAEGKPQIYMSLKMKNVIQNLSFSECEQVNTKRKEIGLQNLPCE